MNAETAAEFFNNHQKPDPNHHQQPHQRKFKNSNVTNVKKPLKKNVTTNVQNNCSTDKSDDNTYMSVHVHNTSNEDNGDDTKLLKRSPVVRDVTSGFAQISNTDQLIRRKMTILVPSLEKTISLEALNPGTSTKEQHEVPHMR